MSSTTLVPDNVIHEAIDERQHVRTRIPAKVILSGGGLTGLECDIQDISSAASASSMPSRSSSAP